jgi:hypothetical protein
MHINLEGGESKYPSSLGREGYNQNISHQDLGKEDQGKHSI